MITARQSKDWWRFLIGMKNFILEVATSRPSFSTSQTHLGDVSFLRRWPLLLPFSESAPRCSAKVSKYSFRKVLNCEMGTFLNI